MMRAFIPDAWWRAGSLMAAGAAAAVLAGCQGGDMQDLQQWMAQTKSQSPIATTRLSEPKKFQPFTYGEAAVIDPFNPSKLLVALSRDKARGGGLAPDMERRREVLENYPLDAIAMVGTLQRHGVTIALVRADKTVFQAKVGNYAGQNFGVIRKISDTEVTIKELVQDASGEWVEREASLALQENQK